MKKIYLTTWAFLIMLCANAQLTVPLYPGEMPNSIVSTDKETRTDWGNNIYSLEFISLPTLTIYSPAKKDSKTPAVIICPGGGYWGLAMTPEGVKVAEALQEMGVTAIILKYRMPSDSTMQDKTIGPLQDVQQAFKIARLRADEWNIDINKIGVAGFSAGGHLAASAGTHYNDILIKNDEQINLRPDFMILVYPVISCLDSITHIGSRDNLLGKNPSKKKINFFSNELHVNKNTPPAFIVHAGDDKLVKVDNSICFYQALHKNDVEAALFIYPKGGHGFGLNNATTSDRWMDHCKEWLISNGWLH